MSRNKSWLKFNFLFSFPDTINTTMADLGPDKVLAMLIDTERVADQILMNKQEIVELDKRRQGNREALNELKRTKDQSSWTSVGCILVKLKKETAVQMLEEGEDRSD